jgi:DNA polymerase V
MFEVKNIARAGNIDFYSANTSSELALPLVDGGIVAGFPSPAQDYIDLKIDLNKELVANPSSTFYGRVKGTSMQDAGIMDGDILVIDKSLEPQDGAMAVCFLDGEFTLKYIRIEKDAVYLIPANSKFQPIKVTEDNNFCIWGIVTYSIKNHKRK